MKEKCLGCRLYLACAKGMIRNTQDACSNTVSGCRMTDHEDIRPDSK